VSASMEVSLDGKAMKFYEVAPFALYLTPELITDAARTLSTNTELEAEPSSTTCASRTTPCRRSSKTSSDRRGAYRVRPAKTGRWRSAHGCPVAWSGRRRARSARRVPGR
jgi:hypothetical protein